MQATSLYMPAKSRDAWPSGRATRCPMTQELGHKYAHNSCARQQAQKSRWHERFEVSQEVLLAIRNLDIDQHLLAKQYYCWIGPFPITKVISLVAYQLDVPLRWKIRPVFYISNLKRHFSSPELSQVESPPPPILVEGEEEYEV